LHDHSRASGIVFVEIVVERWPAPDGFIDVEEELPATLRCDLDAEHVGLGTVVRLQHPIVASHRADARDDLEPFVEEMPLQRPEEHFPDLGQKPRRGLAARADDAAVAVPPCLGLVVVVVWRRGKDGDLVSLTFLQPDARRV
jgi:hypothetical protein